MEISQREADKVVILDIQGEIDLYIAPEIIDTIQKLIEVLECNIMINLEKVLYIDSSGIGALI